MGLHELPASRQHAWLLDGESELSRTSTPAASTMRRSVRRAFKWGAACSAIVAGFALSVFLFLMITVPEPTSYMG